MEFRFAHVALRKPIILCVVGTGYKWESTEVWSSNFDSYSGQSSVLLKLSKNSDVLQE